MNIIKKIKIILKHNPYKGYWADLLTERHLKKRIGSCDYCGLCCQKLEGGFCDKLFTNIDNCHICSIYNNRECNILFPISQKELEYFYSIMPNFKCSYKFKDKL